MKRAILFFFGLALAVPAPPAAAAPEFSGRLKLFASTFLAANPQGAFFSHDALAFASKRLELRLRFAGELSGRVSYQARFDAYAYPGDLADAGAFPEAGVLGSALGSEHFELSLYEASVKVADFLVPRLDLTIGKQRIQWGSADKMNVVDNLDPVDLANFFTFDPDYFGERRPQTAVNLEYYLGNSGKLQLVWQLQNPLSPLPYGYGATLARLGGLDSVAVKKYWGRRLDRTPFGLRLSRTIGKVDAALTYFNGNSSLPLLQELGIGAATAGVFYYPRLQVLGIDIAGEFMGAGFWGEAALVVPEAVTGQLRFPVVVNGLPVVTATSFRLLAKSYWKYVLGLDYAFGGGFYANLQFLHGFFDEFAFSAEAEKFLGLGQGRFFGDLADYLFGRLEYKSGNEKLRLKASGLLEKNAAGTALALLPEAEFRIADAVIAQLGGFWLLAGDAAETKFGMFKSDSLVFLGLKIDF